MIGQFGLEVFDAVVLLLPLELVAPGMSSDNCLYARLFKGSDEVREVVEAGNGLMAF